MKVFHHPDTLLHNPSHEILGGKEVNYFESPSRITIIKDALEADPDNFDLTDSLDNTVNLKEWILKVHDSDYVDYLEHAYESWVKDGGNEVCSDESSIVSAASVLSNIRKLFSQKHSRGSGCCPTRRTY